MDSDALAWPLELGIWTPTLWRGPSSTCDSNSNSDSDSTTNFHSSLSLTSCSPDSLSSEPNTHPMTSSLGYKQNAKRIETNVIGDGLLLTNFRTAKRTEMKHSPP